MNYPGFIAAMLLLWISGVAIGISLEHWRTSPLRRIKKKYRAERKSALRD